MRAVLVAGKREGGGKGTLILFGRGSISLPPSQRVRGMERALPENQYRHKAPGDRDKESDRWSKRERERAKVNKTGTKQSWTKKGINAKMEWEDDEWMQERKDRWGRRCFTQQLCGADTTTLSLQLSASDAKASPFDLLWWCHQLKVLSVFYIFCSPMSWELNIKRTPERAVHLFFAALTWECLVIAYRLGKLPEKEN